MTYGNEAAYYSENYNYINEVEETEATKALIDTYKEFTCSGRCCKRNHR